MESDQAFVVRHSGNLLESASSLQAIDPGAVVLSSPSSSKRLTLANIEQLIRPKPVLEDLVWKGNLDFALDYRRVQKDTDDYDIDFKTLVRHGVWRHSTHGEYNRKLSSERVSADNWSLEYALDRFIGERWFWAGRLSYKRDRIEDLSHQRSVGSGPGYQFWDNEVSALSVGSLAGRTDYRFASEQSESVYFLGVKWDYRRRLPGSAFELFSNGEFSKPLGAQTNYALDALAW